MDLLAYFYDPGSLADTTLAYCMEIPDLERNLSTVTLGRVPQLMEWILQPYPFDFLIRLILLWGIGMEVCPYGLGASPTSLVPGKGSYHS